MHDFFISYSRKDEEIVSSVVSGLNELGFSVWLDQRDVQPSAEWWETTKQGIEEALSFLFFISEHSIKSKWCSKELEHAEVVGKKIITASLQEVDESKLPVLLSAIQTVPLTSDKPSIIKQAVQMIRIAHETDLSWVVAHSRLENRALEWQKAKKNRSLLLRGDDLKQTEALFSSIQGVSKGPAPTSLQLEYIKLSREGAVSFLRKLVGGISLAFFVVTVLAIIAIFQARLAEDNAVTAENNASTAQAERAIAQTQEGLAVRQSQVSQSLALAALAENALNDGDSELAVSLAYAAVQIQDPPQQSISSLYAVTFSPGTKTVISGIGQGGFRVVYSPDGRLIASGSAAGEIALYDSYSGSLICTLGDHGTYDDSDLKPLTLALSFSSDGRFVLSYGVIDIVYWDVQTCSESRRIPMGGSYFAESVAFTSDGGKAFLGTRFGTVRLIDLQNGDEHVVFLDKHSESIKSVAVNQDGTVGASGSVGNEVKLWDLETGNLLATYEAQSLFGQGDVWSLAFAPDGRFLAAGGSFGIVQVWDIQSGKEVIKIDANQGEIMAITFNPDGTLVAFSGPDFSVQVRSVSTGQLIYRLAGPYNNLVTDLDFDPSGRYLLGTSLDGTIRITDLTNGNQKVELSGHTARVRKLQLSADGQFLLSSSFDGSVRLWSLVTDTEIWRYKPGTAEMQILAAISPDSKLLLVHTADELRLVTIETGETQLSLHTGYGQTAIDVGFLRNGEFIYLIENEKTFIPEASVRIWNAVTGEEQGVLFDIGTNSMILSKAAVSGDLMTIGSIHFDMPLEFGNKGLALWDWSSNAKILQYDQLPSFGSITALAIGSDGQYTAAAENNDIDLYENSNGQKINTLLGHSGIISDLSFFDEQRKLVSGSIDGTVKIWSVSDAQEISTLNVGNPIWSVALTRGDNRVVAGTESGSIVIEPFLDSVTSVLEWIHVNRYMKPLTCSYLFSIGISDCAEFESLDGVIGLNENSIDATGSVFPSQGESVNTDLENAFLLSGNHLAGNFDGTTQSWSFTAKAGEKLSIKLSSKEFDPYLVLYDKNYKILSSNDDISFETNDAGIFDFVPAYSGKYYLLVDEFCLNCPAADEALPFDIFIATDSLEHTVSNLQQVSRGPFGIAYTWTSGHLLEITNVAEGSGAQEAGLLVGDEVVAINGKYLSSLTPREYADQIRLPDSAFVDLLIRRNNNQFHLTLRSHSYSSGDDLQVVEPLPVELGKKISATLKPGETDVYEFEAAQGDIVGVYAGGGRSPLLEMRIISPDGELIKQVNRIDDLIGSLYWSWNSILPYIELDEAGTYTVEVTSNNTDESDVEYSFVVSSVRPKGIADGEEVMVDYLSSTEGQVWSFEAEKGSLIELNLAMQDSLIEPFLFLMAPSGEFIYSVGYDGYDKIDSHYVSNDDIQIPINGFLLPETGEYKLVISPYVRFTPVSEKFSGHYTLTLELQKPSFHEITVGQTYNGVIEQGGYDLFVYHGKEGETFSLLLEADESSKLSDFGSYSEFLDANRLDLYLTIYGPEFVFGAEGDETDESEDSPDILIIGLTMPETGDLFFRVGSYKDLSAGGYSFKLAVE